MDHHEPFLQDIAANPDDDVPRLIYADWLDDQGDPRGEFICVQRELARNNGQSSGWFDTNATSVSLLQKGRITQF